MNQQVVDYIKQSRASGIEDGTIRQALLDAGFPAQEIDESFQAENLTLGSAPVPIPVLPPIPNSAPVPDLTPPVQNLKPSFMSRFKLPKLRFSGKLVKILAIVSALLIFIIGGYFAVVNYLPQYAKYVQPYLGPVLDPVLNGLSYVTDSLPFIGGAPYKPDEILKAFEKTVSIDSARYKAHVFIETQDRDGKIKPLLIKIPAGEVPEDLKKSDSFALYSDYYGYGSNKKKEIKPEDATIIELNELKPAMDAIAIDKAKIKLAGQVLGDLGAYYKKNKKDPAVLSELKEDNITTNPNLAQYPYYDYKYWGSLEGKYFTYSASPDQMSFKLTINLESPQSIEDLKKIIENLKKRSSYYNYGFTFNEGSIVFEDKKVIFNERSVNISYDISYPSYNTNQSLADQIAYLFSDSSSGYLSYVPGRFKLDLNVGGIMQSGDSKSFYIQLGGKADFEDMLVEADFEFTNLDKDSFFKINKFPSIFMDVSKVREEWIKLPQIASKSSGSSYYSYGSDVDYYSSYANSIQQSITDSREKSDRQLAQMRKLASVAEKEKIIIASGSPVKEEINGNPVYKYLISIDENKLASFYEKAVAELKEYGADSLIPEDEFNKVFFGSNGLKEIIKYLKDTSDFYVWVDSSGYIVKFEYILKYVPYVASDDKTGSNKQFNISTSLELSEINSGLEIKSPGKFIEWKEAISKLFGVTEEAIGDATIKARNSQRSSNVNTLLNAITQRMVDNKGLWKNDNLCNVVLPSVATEIGSGSGKIDLDPCLVPTYVISIPFDPSKGSEIATGYTVMKGSTGRITISALHAEDGESISITR